MKKLPETRNKMDVPKTEEKKLTDEEVLTAIELCFKARLECCKCPYFNKNGRNFCIEDKAFYKDMKRIVQEHSEQKAEIERLTEENDILSKVIGSSKRKTRIYELQKQVDELKENLGLKETLYKRARESGYCTGYKSAVKDTAKEILQELYEYPHEYHEKKILEIARRKGVEVK